MAKSPRLGSRLKTGLLLTALALLSPLGARGAAVFAHAGPAQRAPTLNRPAAPRAEEAPAAREGALMAYDAGHGVTVLFGGSVWRPSGPRRVSNDTWLWDGASWTRAAPEHSPPLRSGSAMTYDAARERVVLFGGFLQQEEGLQPLRTNETWLWDGADWAQASPETSPPPRNGASLAYDSDRGVSILFGGFGFDGATSTTLTDTWLWDGDAWTEATPAGPTPSKSGEMVYDVTRRLVVLFISPSFRSSNETWLWDGKVWTRATPARSPRPRFGAALAYDAARGVVLLFGGGDAQVADAYLGDTWIWDGTDWSMAEGLTMRPRGRAGAAITYDAGRQVVVLFGGTQFFSGPFSDLWLWDGVGWRQAATVTAPEPPGLH